MTVVYCPKCGEKGSLQGDEKNGTVYYRVFHEGYQEDPSNSDNSCWLGTKEKIKESDDMDWPITALNGEREMEL